MSRRALQPDKQPAPEKLVGALSAGLKVLRYLIRSQTGVGVNHLARELDLNLSTTYNLLRTLVHERLVTFDPATKAYAVGLGTLELATSAIDGDRTIRVVRPLLEGIAQSHRVTATLWQRMGDDRVVLVDRADSGSALRVHMTIGQRLPLLIAALGRCMAAYGGFTREELRRRFDALRWENAPDFEAYWRDVQQVRERGYAVDRDNFVRGVSTLSAPILDMSGTAVMAISAVGFTAQFSDAAMVALAADVTRCARDVSGAIGVGRSLPAGDPK